MSLPQNTSKGKRDIRFEAHNRRPGIAAFWRSTGERKSRRWANRINKWRVEGKVGLPPIHEESHRFRDNKERERKVWSSTFEDLLTEEERQALLDIHD